MKEIKLENINVFLFAESNIVRVESNGKNIIFTNQDIESITKPDY